jgi:hypothetical protein
MLQQTPAPDLGRQLMSDWFATVSYEDDYTGGLPETEAEDPADGVGNDERVSP